ncbi:hypothetical protein TUBRATIS_23230 [Tubulinosema ratisbonensis]|uniref:Uncharacterized protein n=1 Tax=Tubulinosema ratisbonensis TaxID=291195 RepID=A0A437AJF1_9MICR|nr:hypothetical protein TUBRATIS_23230 [Tubulinosema ratisbonensis]
MFLIYLQVFINRLIINNYVILNKAGFAQHQLYAKDKSNVILKTITNLTFKENDKNLLYIFPIRKNVYRIKLSDDRYLFYNRYGNSIFAKELKYKKGTKNYDDGFEWKIHETGEGLKFESMDKCLQVFNSKNYKDIFFIKGVRCTENKDQLFEMVKAIILKDNSEIYINGIENKKEKNTAQDPHTLNLIINGLV